MSYVVSSTEKVRGKEHPNLQKIRWIHFSDLHLGDDEAVDTRLMRRNLPAYIASLNISFDYAFCTGDVKEWSSDFSNSADFLNKILIASRTPVDRFFIVPGNHDVDIDTPRSNDREELISKLTDWNSNYYQSSRGVISPDDLALIREGEEGFIAFIDNFFGSDRAEQYRKSPHFVIQTPDFNILHVDTALTYSKRHKTDMLVGTRLLMDALDNCDPMKPTIFLTHYPFSALEMQERNEVEALLDNYHVQLWLAGHEHENQIHFQREKFLEVQSGNVAFQNGAKACILVGEYDPETGEGSISVHAWYPSKGWEFYPFARTGTDDNGRFPFALRLPGDNRAADVSIELSNAREAAEKLLEAGNIFSGVHVNSSILTDLECNGITYFNKDRNIPLDSIINKLWFEKGRNSSLSCNALILGDGGMGKSTAMFDECRRLLENKRLALYISLQARENAGYEKLTDFILRSLYKSVDDRARSSFIQLVSARHTHPDMVLFIDGFNELSGEGAQRYVSEIKDLSQYAGIQVIISSRLNFLRDFGLSFFGMIHTCELREEQVETLFTGRNADWQNVLAHKNLRILLKNPMMALLYASTCPVVERSADLDYLEWITPISNASDLLHDYYMSQVALLVEREAVDGRRIFSSLVAITRILPAIAYLAERSNTTALSEDEFELKFSTAVKAFNKNYETSLSSHSNQISQSSQSLQLKRVQRRFRIHKNIVYEDDVYDLVITELCLLKSGNGRVSFAHQIFRDYLAALFLHNALVENFSVESLWHKEEIHRGVVQYLRYIGNESTWGANGTVSQMLKPYRGKEAEENDWFVANVLNCWLSIGDGEKDLSDLDLRRIPLTEHLRAQFNGTININNAWVAKETLINNKRHDRIIGIAFSHDNHTMAAVSRNGVVSITNLITMSQMIVGTLEVKEGDTGSDQGVAIGFDADDYLIVYIDKKTYKWPTISYDKVVEGSPEDIISIPITDDEVTEQISALKKLLKESDLEGVISQPSENGKFLSVGFESGFLQVWDVEEKECIADLSLSDNQIATASFTKDGRIAALGSGSKIVQLWDVVSQRCLKTLFFDHRVSKVRFPADEQYLDCQFSDGSYKKVNLDSGVVSETKRPDADPFRSKALQKAISSMSIADIKTASDGNAVVVTTKGEAYTWDEKRRSLHACPGHRSKVTAIAICSADTRFAASYSPENYVATRDDKDRRGLLNGQKLVRVRIIKTGQCQWRLPTKGHSIRKLQFFTTNRIILAGFATNGDILLWELINEPAPWGERGHWEMVEIVRNNQAEPLECAVPSNKKDFISAYDDGTINIRPFSRPENGRTIRTIPGIDADVFRWRTVKSDPELRVMLSGYTH